MAARVRRRQGGTGTGDFQHSKTPLCDAVTMNAGRCMFVQPHRKHTAKSNPNVNDGLWVTTMSQCRSISCFKKKVPLWWGMSIAGETVHVCGQGVEENSVYFLLNFAVDLKLH